MIRRALSNRLRPLLALVWVGVSSLALGVVEVSDLAGFAAAAAKDGQTIRLQPGTYRMADYLTDAVLEEIRAGFKPGGRPPVAMMRLTGSNNRFELDGVILEIDTTLYPRLPQGGYTRCVMVTGGGNHIRGLVIRNTGPNDGSNGNILSVMGKGNTLENVTLHVNGSFPWGYGDLLGKGGPNLVPLRKQSGIQICGDDTTLRGCRVTSRAFGHCFYVQEARGVLFEDCHAEGVMRPTAEMLRDVEGPAFEKGFETVYRNRDGRYLIVPGYMKSLVEDGFRTYGNAGRVRLVNCTAVNTRAGFEIGVNDHAKEKSVLENCTATGCERGFLIGSNVIIRGSRGDITYGPLLYLRGGQGSDVELELVGGTSDFTVHALATIAGKDHRVVLSEGKGAGETVKVPVLLGFGMPAHGEMASPIEPAAAVRIELVNRLAAFPVVTGSQAEACKVESAGRVVSDAQLSAERKGW
jgi:hypothetical protein